MLIIIYATSREVFARYDDEVDRFLELPGHLSPESASGIEVYGNNAVPGTFSWTTGVYGGGVYVWGSLWGEWSVPPPPHTSTSSIICDFLLLLHTSTYSILCDFLLTPPHLPFYVTSSSSTHSHIFHCFKLSSINIGSGVLYGKLDTSSNIEDTVTLETKLIPLVYVHCASVSYLIEKEHFINLPTFKLCQLSNFHILSTYKLESFSFKL